MMTDIPEKHDLPPAAKTEPTAPPKVEESALSAALRLPEYLSPEGLSALLERYHLAPLRSAEPLVAGSWGDALLVNGEVVMRFGQEEAACANLLKEAVIFRRLNRSSDVPAPEVIALDTKRDIIPYDVLIVTYLQGMSGAAVWKTLTYEARDALSEEVGRMLGAIHGLLWSSYGEFNPEAATFGRYSRWTDMLLERAANGAEQAVATGSLPQGIVDGVITELNDGDSVLATASKPVLVHSVLDASNLLFQERDGIWHVAAILNWGSSLTADAAWEFAIQSFRRAETSLLGDAVLYGYRERRPVQTDLRSRMLLYKLLCHVEAATAAHARGDMRRRTGHENALRKLLML